MASIKKYPLLLFTLLLCHCQPAHHNKKGIEAAMHYYDHLIKNVDADSIAMLFTTDGNLSGMAKGRDSIKKFLTAFKNVWVLSQTSTTIAITINGDSAIQNGNYYQTVVINQKDTLKVKGKYVANWLWLKNEGWHIKRMTTEPMK